jgi:predicted phosphoribosyltransferase
VRIGTRIADLQAMNSDFFCDRRDAGRQLAQRLAEHADRQDVVVLALPRGGMPVAFEVARELHAPLDVFVVRKLGVPGHEEYAMGAIASGGVRVVDAAVLRGLGISLLEVDAVEATERTQLEQREAAYRGRFAPLSLMGRTALVIDDGLATGSTMQAAVRALRQQRPARVIVAVPVASAEAVSRLRREADDIVCVAVPQPFTSVGQWYADFPQTSDDEVLELLQMDRKANHEVVVPTR